GSSLWWSGRSTWRARATQALWVWRERSASSAMGKERGRAAANQVSLSRLRHTLHGWGQRAELQATRKAVMTAKERTATLALGRSRLRRALRSWVEGHSARSVARVTLVSAVALAQWTLQGRVFRAWKAFKELQARRLVFRSRVLARKNITRQAAAFRALAEGASRAKLYREKVSSALALWKFHTQGKAFTALVAYRNRRRRKNDRASRAVRWRREALILEGARRWSEMADSLAAARIERTAVREAQVAIRRWQCVGRCARRWRRVAAARAMERRAKAAAHCYIAPPGDPVNPLRAVPRTLGLWVGAGSNTPTSPPSLSQAFYGNRGISMEVLPTGAGSAAPAQTALGLAKCPPSSALGPGAAALVATDMGPNSDVGTGGVRGQQPTVANGPEPLVARPEHQPAGAPPKVAGLGFRNGSKEYDSPPSRDRAYAPVKQSGLVLRPGGGAGAAGAPDMLGQRHRRTPPRRPLELLLEKASTPEVGRGVGAQAGAMGGDNAPRVSPMIPPWVVAEMNRLYGSGSSSRRLGSAPGKVKVTAEGGLAGSEPRVRARAEPGGSPGVRGRNYIQGKGTKSDDRVMGDEGLGAWYHSKQGVGQGLGQ
ncbi:unnamed protein product, partial [Discosporangium mesarthrocarpum]